MTKWLDMDAWPALLKIPGDAVWSSKSPPNTDFQEKKICTILRPITFHVSKRPSFDICLQEKK